MTAPWEKLRYARGCRCCFRPYLGQRGLCFSDVAGIHSSQGHGLVGNGNEVVCCLPPLDDVTDRGAREE